MNGDPRAACARCGRTFTRHRAGHIYCSSRCRRGKPLPVGRPRVDLAAVRRLFDPARDPGERVQPSDWHAADHDSPFRALDSLDTVAARRYWFRHLEAQGEP